MNPFDWPGPQFLAFYTVFSAATILGLWLWLGRSNEGGGQAARLTDPYVIAYLRGGREEALRVATVSLIDRGLLKAEDEEITAAAGAEEMVRRPLEKAILVHFRLHKAGSSVFEIPHGEVAAACRQYQLELEQRGLVPGADRQGPRAAAVAAALALLLGVAGIKIAVALSRGRHNIVFLLFLAGVGVFATLAVARRPRTALGDRLLGDLRRGFQGLKERAGQLTAGGATNEAVLLAAIWGLAALPALGFPYVRALRPKPTHDGGASAGGCGGGGCGSAGGGGGCGGGGCGGGCGGCGG